MTNSTRRTPTALLATVAAAAGLTLLASCATSPTSSGTGADGTLRVVAAQNVWGSIAEQIGGEHVEVTNIIDTLAADPHDFEPTTQDARAVAGADLVIVNGAGYDGWATRLVDANPSDRRVVLDVGELVGVEGEDHGDSHGDSHDHDSHGTNPHLWYDPDTVSDVAEQVGADLARLAPEHASEFTAAADRFETQALAPLRAELTALRRAHSGTKVGASESFFAMLAPAAGLELITPTGFVNAVSEGFDPRTDDKAAADQQIADRRIAVYVANTQNATPDVDAQVRAAQRAGIPVVSMTESLAPSGTTFQDWQTAQLRALRAALDSGARRDR